MNSGSHKRTLFGCLLIVALTFAAFHASLDNEFVNWDDPVFIYENPRIQTLDWVHIRELFTSFEAGAYTPLSQLSLAIDYALWKDDPAGFHLTSLLLHCLNACLVFFLSRHLIQKTFSPPPSSFGHVAAFVAALLFSLHPLRVESVAWASERRDVLSGFFGLACALAYARYAELRSPQSLISSPGSGQDLSPQRSFRWFLITLLLFVCAAISKAVVITLPLVFMLLDIHPFRRLSFPNPAQAWRRVAEVFREKLPLLAVSLGIGLTLMDVLLDASLALSVQKAGWEQRIAQMLVANMDYLGKMLVPINLNPLDQLRRIFYFNQSIVWGGLAINGAITGLLILFRRRFPSALIAWLAYLILIGPFLGIAQSGMQLTADRYTYLASVPLCILAGGVFQRFWNGQPSLLPHFHFFMVLIAISTLAWLGYRTHMQTQVWKNSEVLLKHTLKIDPENSIAWNNLGVEVAKKGEAEKAIRSFKQAIRLEPGYADAWYNLGNRFRALQRYPQAVRAYQQALIHDPSHTKAHHNLGLVDAHFHDWSSALRHYRVAQRLAPSAAIEYDIGCCLREKGETAAALQCFRSAAQQGFADAWAEWSDLIAQQGDLSTAIAILKEGAQRTGQSRVQLACVEMLFRQPQLSQADLSCARELLRELDDKTKGRSQTVRALQSQLNLRASRSVSPSSK